MKIGNSECIRAMDKYCIENLGIPSMVLMENAALKVVENLDLNKFNSFTVVCGSGNNGGDGLAVARHLYALGKKIDVFLLGFNRLSEDCKNNFTILKNMGIHVNLISSTEDLESLRQSVSKSDVTIDAIFGTGLKRDVSGIYDLTITVINENSNYVLAIDIASGVNSDSGKIMANSIKANKTVSFVVYKMGFLNYEAHNMSGEIVVENIGMPKSVIDKFCDNTYMLDEEYIKSRMKKRSAYAHKGEYGRATIVAGSKGFSGAATITTNAVVRSGAGLVTLCTYGEIQDIVASKLLEAMTADIENEESIKILSNSSVIAIGPGMGNTKRTYEVLENVVHKTKSPMVIDADALNVLSQNKELLSKLKNRAVLTPHLGEMSRLCGLNIEEIKINRIKVAKSFAKENNIVVLLKGYNTIITDGESIFINPTGNSSMANGGMGDTLTGIIASLIAQGYEVLHATCIAAFIHGYIGDKLSNDMFIVNASHIIESLPTFIKDFF